MIQIVIVFGLLLTIIFLMGNTETFGAPWDLQRCRMACYQAGRRPAWFGGHNPQHWGPSGYVDPTHFDTPGCMDLCDRTAWGI